jgi:hypothetical protein
VVINPIAKLKAKQQILLKGKGLVWLFSKRKARDTGWNTQSKLIEEMQRKSE